MKKFIFSSILMLMLVNFSFAQKKEFGWLLGTWKLRDKNVFESWTETTGGNNLAGTSYRVKGADTVVSEQIQLTYSENSFHYIPDIAGDQGGVDFKITQHTDHGFIAENPQHDFPKIIRYTFVRKENKDILEASIEGDGKVIPFVFERVQ